ISGTPTQSGTYTVTLNGYNNCNGTDSKVLTITIDKVVSTNVMNFPNTAFHASSLGSLFSTMWGGVVWLLMLAIGVVAYLWFRTSNKLAR
ncbi:hypothetical protein H0W91_00620, partial [Patescibacteria group bacterium]|nr:hypothetical protein [Patescibacteria group bacterium]